MQGATPFVAPQTRALMQQKWNAVSRMPSAASAYGMTEDSMMEFARTLLDLWSVI